MAGSDFWMLNQFSPAAAPVSAEKDENGNVVFDPTDVPFVGPEILGTPGLWDVITLNGIKLPGIWDVKVQLGIRLDMKTPKGVSAARLEFSGYKAAEVSCTGVFWTESQWAIFYDTIIPLIRPANTTKLPSAQAIYHPVLSRYNILKVVLTDIDGPNSQGTDAKGRQFKTVTLKCLEDLPKEWKKDESQSGESKLITKGQDNDLRTIEREVGFDPDLDEPDPAQIIDYAGPTKAPPIMTPIGAL